MTFPFYPVAGGLLIGTASMAVLMLLGRVAGMSGVVWGGLVGPDRLWRGIFVAGLLLGGLATHSLGLAPLPTTPSGPLWLAALSGVLVGFGTRLGSGCTSGHSVCGIGRKSARSVVATMVFMSTGIVVVYLTRHVVGWLA